MKRMKSIATFEHSRKRIHHSSICSVWSEFDNSASSTIIGNILMVSLTLILASVVAIQVMQFAEKLDFSGDMWDVFGGGGGKDDLTVEYSVFRYENNLTISIVSISKEIDINSVNYQLYNITIEKNEEDGYLLDITDSNETKVQFHDADNDGHFSEGDWFFIQLGRELGENEYILILSSNSRPNLVYEITFTESGLKGN